MNIKQTVILTLIALLGSVMGFFVINIFITPLSISSYIGIELIISLLHAMYNKAKIQTFKN